MLIYGKPKNPEGFLGLLSSEVMEKQSVLW